MNSHSKTWAAPAAGGQPARSAPRRSAWTDAARGRDVTPAGGRRTCTAPPATSGSVYASHARLTPT